MNPLEEDIRARIASEGPLSIADYMALCLTHPKHGYYTSGNPIGGRGSAARTGGDFITAPEVSQMFGEMLAVWAMEMWQALGAPSRFALVEIGPGRGTLMADLLRAARALPPFLDAAQIVLVEVSPTLAEQQSLALSKSNAQVAWVSDLDGLPDLPAITIANEFLDALPFRQWIKHEGNWHERAVGLIDDALAFTTRASVLDRESLPSDAQDQPDGTIFETAPAREAFATRLAAHLAEHDGAALLIDYGHTKSDFGDTFQAVRNHAYDDPLAHPGEADLTSHVDFEPLAGAARSEGCTVADPVTQGDLLLSLGLLERAGALGAGKPPHIQQDLQAAVDRLVRPDQMGTLFKALAFGHPASLANRFPGFA